MRVPSHVGIDDADSGQDLEIKQAIQAAGCFYCLLLGMRSRRAALRQRDSETRISTPHSVQCSSPQFSHELDVALASPATVGRVAPSSVSHGGFPLPLAGCLWRGRFPQLKSTSPGLAPCTVPAPPNHSPPTTTMSRFAGVKQMPAIGCR
jgi:hypothetical protein